MTGSVHDGRAPSVWRLAIPVALVAMLGLALTVGMVGYMRHQVQAATESVVDVSVGRTAEHAGQSLGALNGSLDSVAGLFELQSDLTDEQFQAFVARTFGDRADIQAVEYAPLVGHSQRKKYERRLRAAGHVRGITDPTADGLLPSPKRPQYLPVTYAAPASRNRDAVGLDVLSRPENAETVRLARDSGNTQLASLTRIVQGDTPALLMYEPLFTPTAPRATIEQRRNHWMGTAIGVLRVREWMDSAFSSSDPELTSVMLIDSRGQDQEVLWASDESLTAEDTVNWTSRASVPISDNEELTVVGAPTPKLIAQKSAWRPWAAAAVGLIGTFLLALMLWKWLDARRIRRTADDLQQATNRLRFLAERDPLTGLPHRDGLRSWVDEWGQRNPDRSLAVMFIDLDGFKEVNTTWGHPTGDLVLRQIGQRLQVISSDPDSTVARLGGDEFVVTRAVDRGSIDGLATMVQTLISEPIAIGDRDVQLTSSIGIAVRPEDGVSLDTLLTNADIAVRAAKLRPSDAVVRFDPIMAAQGAAHRQLARALRMAMRHPDRHFFLEYQPQIDMRTGKLVGAEALVRWTDMSGRLISPMEFIPLAREQGLMHGLGRWVLDRSCQALAEWRRTCDAVLAVNVDTQQLTEDFAGVISTILADRAVEAESLFVEITESAAMHESAQREIDRTRSLGVAIAIDDFGTGFSSLSRLADLPAQQIKIDRAFVAGLGSSAESLEIVRTIVALARALNMDTLAEGVETPRQAQILLAEGVSTAQGFLFSRPVSSQVCHALWETGVTVPESLRSAVTDQSY
ncbi:MAG: EAL domain-containing protein [Candidatus Nanopelagicales bacterium]|nr:EAL domain-containing protein [Candidatus Nanopelagicales bacterium]